jgi:alkanesulfonate monooxygenase SsuD/methylene tetrahydromethanopterin reductase-like flavin-dependent oxidoreductase (luciferase family)
MIGSSAPRMLELTARYAEAWNTYYDDTGNAARGVPALRARVDAACAAVGRDPATLERTASVLLAYPGPVGPKLAVEPLRGAPEELATALRAYADEGITHLQVQIEPHTPASLHAFARVIELLDRA